MASSKLNKADIIRLRILVDTTINGIAIDCGKVVDIDAATAKSLIDGGIADPSAEAIAYAIKDNPDVIDLIEKPMIVEAQPEIELKAN